MTLAPSRVARVFSFVITACCASAIALGADGCGSDAGDPIIGPTSDAPAGKESSATEDDGGEPVVDAGKDSPTTKPDAEGGASNSGETCIGFGKGTPCGTATFPEEYGYVCFNGGPPGLTGCKQASASGFGDTWCCPENECVAQPDQDAKECKTAGKPHRYQCPPNGSGGNVAPPAGCTGGDAGSAVEVFYCCP
jgi:hypothetical protein